MFNSSETLSFFLAIQGWQKIVGENQPLIAVNRIVKHFSVPLVSAGVDVDEILCEFQGISTLYISLSTSDYRAVWWRLFYAPCASEWTNVLALAELLFSLPASNGIVERVFSWLKIIKSDKRTSLANDTLNDLLTVSMMNCSLKDFDPDKATDLWWRVPSVHVEDQSEYEQSESDSEAEPFELLGEWDSIFGGICEDVQESDA